MSSSGQHKEAQWPLSPLSASSVSPATPHYRTPQSQDGLFPVYNPHEEYKSRQDWPMQNGNGHTNGAVPPNYGAYNYGTSVGAAARRPKPWWMLGYEKWTGLALFVFFGGAILGFSLSRTPMLSFNELLKLTTPGEGYWYSKSPGKANIIIHIFTSLPASFFSVFCFLPITYNRWPRFHSVLGYIVSVLLLVSLVCGAIVGRRAQGGDLNVQAGVYMLASGSAFAVIMGILEARRGALNEHREWMLRAWFYNGAFVTTRVTALLSAQVITAINSYFSLWQCAEVAFVLPTREALAQGYPQCVTPEALSNPNGVHVAVHASWNEDKLGRASASRASFGMALWVAMLLHCVGIEFYLRATARESKQQLKELSDRRTDGLDSEMPHRSSRAQTLSKAKHLIIKALMARAILMSVTTTERGGASAQLWTLKAWGLLGIRSTLPCGPISGVPTAVILTTMSLQSSRYLLNGLVFLCVLSQAAYMTNAQRTNATCDRSFDWANNSKGQSPCLVAAYLQGQCYPDKQWNVSSLLPGTQYLAPTGDEATGCACASPVYSLISACAACQGASYMSWGQWTANCPAARVNNGTFPFQVPTDTVIPQWALDKIDPSAYLDLDAAHGKGSGDAGLSGATIFLIVLLPIILIGLGGFGLWMIWKRRQRRARRESISGKEPLLSHTGSRTTFLSVDTTSEVHIHLTQNSLDSGHGYSYDKPWPQPSPTPRTPESAGYSPHPLLSPGSQYPPGYHPHQQFLVPPSAGPTSAGFTAPYHPSPGIPPAPPSAAVRPLSQPPHTGATTQTFASQQNEFSSNPNRQSYPGPTPPPEIENDSGTFPRAPVEPQLPSLPLGDPRRLLPPSVYANAPST